MPSVRVSVGSRLHVGFQNLSLSHERLYGGVGVAIEDPRIELTAAPADAVTCDDETVAAFARSVCDLIDVDGIDIEVESTLPRHVGLGSGTQLALSTLAAIGEAYGIEPRIRDRAPWLGRGGRSGVGVATFESGGFVVDAGHPTERFTTEPPATGDWDVPAVISRCPVPEEWRFLVVTPDAPKGRSGRLEDRSVRSVVESADPMVADDLAILLLRRLLPALATGRLEPFGDAVSEFGRLNGVWYADEQGGVYRPPAGKILDALADVSAITGLGQSSWGPTVYGIIDVDRAGEARRGAADVLDAAGLEAMIRIVEPRNEGATVRRL
ncbi:MAG: beta-ribofuranosylaminobenzene 5'-phosphate synthase family protein [Natronomonas sp.]